MEIQFEGDGFQAPKHGLILLQSMLFAFFVIFLLRFWYLQILEGEKYARLAVNNRYRDIVIDAPRGFIFDSKGVLLAGNQAAYGLTVVREDVQDIATTLEKVSEWTGIPLVEITERYKRATRKVKPFHPILLVSEVPFEKVARIEAARYMYPGVNIVTRPRRFYPKSNMFSHILGYVAEAVDKEIDEDPSLQVGDVVGKHGIELFFEKHLRGSRGYAQREVDATTRILQEKVITEPTAGKDVILSIDAQLQAYLWYFLEGKRGTIVVMEPKTGKIRALVSRPAYDNNLFTKALTVGEWEKIRDDKDKPLHNRAIQAAYPPASLWKLPMTMMLLTKNIDPAETVQCKGFVQIGNQRFRCWKDAGHGIVNMEKALVQSCDVYYYEMAERLGIRYLSKMAQEYGFGSRLGITLPYENGGLLPTPEWKKQRFGRVWQKGETLNFAIGQGYTLVTPLQITSFLSGIVNNGVEMQPQLLNTEEPRIVRILPIEKQYITSLLQWMIATVRSPEGTARVLYTPGVTVGGKTGTAQVTKLRIIDGKRVQTEDLPLQYRDHAWVMAFATKGSATYIITVLIEHGGSGGKVAGPVAKKVIDVLFDTPTKLPLPPQFQEAKRQ